MMLPVDKMRLLAIAAIAASITACASTGTYGQPETTVSVQFDPDDFDENEMRQAAISMCRAKGYKTAAVYGAQPTLDRGAWYYRAYGCH